MNTRIMVSVVIATLVSATAAAAQQPVRGGPTAGGYVDPVNGISLQQAMARAMAQEPSLRGARSQIDVAQGQRTQAELRPNPTMSFEQREQAGGADRQTTVGIEWPLDLFRRTGRVGVAERQIAATELTVADRERMLAADVRARYGDVLAAVRDLELLDELIAATRRQHDLLRSRVDTGATPPLEHDLLDVELRRLEADRLLQAGRTEATLFELKRMLGMKADSTVSVSETLEGLVKRESSAGPQAADVSSAVERRSDVRGAAAQIGVADARIDRAQREGRFDVSVFASYMRMDASFPQRGFAADGSLTPIQGLFHNIAAGAMVTIPILNRNQGERDAARAERAAAAAAYDAARLTAESELAAALAQDEHGRRAVMVYSGGAQALARQNLRVVEQSYELGRVTVFDVLAEQRRLIEVERAYTQALRAAYEARTALNRALGELR